MLNTCVLAVTHFMMSDEISRVCELINYVFMVIFTLEAVIKIYGLKCDYFKDSWNLFDFFVVVLTLGILVLTALNLVQDISLIGMLLRTLRTGRVFRLVKRAETLQITFQTLVASAPSIGSLGSLLIMMVFMFAIIG